MVFVLLGNLGHMLGSTNFLEVVKLANQFRTIKQLQLTGSLRVQNKHGVWREICFHMGRLVWATGGNHRVRRWLRCLYQVCPQVQQDMILLLYQEDSQHWEYLLLKTLIEQQQITRSQAIAVIENIVTEILFAILQDSCLEELTYQLSWQRFWDSPIGILNLEPIFQRAENLFSNWHNLELVQYSPNLAPFIKQLDELRRRVSPATYQVMAVTLNGRFTIRDLAIKWNKELTIVGQFLIPYINNDLVGLKEITDLYISGTPSKSAPPVSPREPLAKVICIDDSLQICKIVGDILTQAGYQYASVQDSVQALPALLEHKPSLILLDLVMPVANGYEICSQIRRISMFKHIPVVILTGNDGIVDRVRAKMVGASDFLAKPVQADKLLSVVQKYVTMHSQTLILGSETQA